MRLSVIDRILDKIEKVKCSNLTTSCWNFTGTINRGGYGQIRRKDKMIYVHRYIYWYYNIKLKGTTWEEFLENNEDLFVCHTCDNRRCCNPKHLFLGTNKDNMQDCKIKDRKAKGEYHGNSKLTEKQVLEIYRMRGILQDIADKFGTSFQNVSLIKTGENWGWLTQNI